MEDSILISVIVAAYNIEPWIGRCIESIQRQTYKNLEIIIVDDGSTDSTGQIIDKYAMHDPRIVPIHKENQGLVEARETGILNAHGQFSCFIDGDDTIVPDIYERLLNNAIAYKADISHCGYACCYDDGKRVEHSTDVIYVYNTVEGLRNLLNGAVYETALWDKLYKTEILLNSCYDKSILNNEDLVRNFTLFSRARTSVYQDFVGYEYWHRENSISNAGKAVKRGRDILRAKQSVMDRADSCIQPEATKLLLEACVNNINSICFCTDHEAKLFAEECRTKIKEYADSLPLLSKKNRFIARLILISPMLHKLIYLLYKVIKKELQWKN